jgi:choline dehydrogenase-like flavoprotein
MPAVRITYREHPNDAGLSRFLAERMIEILEAAKAERVFQAGLAGPWAIGENEPIAGSTHFLGTCRMGSDPSNSVLDRFCRAHEVPNLFVVDGSCFPTSGGAPPTHTIMANAFRVADYIVEEGSKGGL